MTNTITISLPTIVASILSLICIPVAILWWRQLIRRFAGQAGHYWTRGDFLSRLTCVGIGAVCVPAIGYGLTYQTIEFKAEQKLAARDEMVSQIPAQWSTVRSILKSRKIRGAAKLELLRPIFSEGQSVCGLPKLGVNQQQYLVETEFYCRYGDYEICNAHREELGKMLVVCIDLETVGQ